WPEAGQRAVDEWRFRDVVARMLQDLGESGEDAWKSVTELRMLIRFSDWAGRMEGASVSGLLSGLLEDGAARDFLKINRFRDIDWFNKEAFEETADWMLTLESVEAAVSPTAAGQRRLSMAHAAVLAMDAAMKRSEYQVGKLLETAGEIKSRPLSGKMKPSGKSKRPAGEKPKKPKPRKMTGRKASKVAAGKKRFKMKTEPKRKTKKRIKRIK
ncbi:MAG: hypothetical protein QUS35_03125, partial [bacterium]|nr:hypothetical protein [bacterium]